MEVNKPDRGVFRGMGKLEGAKFINKKYFPNIRNIHQFQYTHDHLNDYKTSFQSFRPFDKTDYKYHRSKKNTNESQVELGTDKQVSSETQARTRFRKYNFSMPPKPIKHPQEGLGINEYSQRTGQLVGYSTTSNQSFNSFKKLNQTQNVKYKYTRTERFNPITGESKSISGFGYEDFTPAQNRNYKSNNFTVMPTRHHQKYDIISGRKLTQF